MSLRRRRPPQYLELTATKNGTFAASITRVSGAPDCVWWFEDGEEQIGDSCSKAMDGHEQKVVCEIVPKWITTLTANNDGLSAIKNLKQCNQLLDIIATENTGLSLDVSELSETVQSTNFYLSPCIGSIEKLKNAIQLYFGGSTQLVCDIAEMSRVVERIDLTGNVGVHGDLSDFPSTVKYLQISGCVNVTGSNLSHMLEIAGAYLQDQLATQARINAIIQDIWQHRADFTYASGITCNLDGNNAAPSGNVIPPEEGTDWHLDGETWIPLTAGAMVFDVVNDVNSEGFNFWNITVS